MLYCSLASPYQFSVQLCYSRAFFAAFVFPSFFPSFFQNWTGSVSSNKYQKLVLILVNTGQDNDKEWDELFFIVFFLISKSL